MSSTTIVKVKIEELSKYGFKANGRYVNYSKQLSEADKAKVVPGAEFEAEYFIADSGKEYLNKVLSASVTAPKTVKQEENKPDTERAKRFTARFTKKDAIDNTMSKQEWADKDQRISRQGAVQAAVIALAPVVSLEQLPEEAISLAKKMLEFVRGE